MKKLLKDFIPFVVSISCTTIIILFISFLITFLLWDDDSKPELIRGGFLLATAILTSWFAIHKYKQEQRTLRIQKLYFEETFLGFISSMEKIFMHNKENFPISDNLFEKIYYFSKQYSQLNFNVIKNHLIESFENSLSKIQPVYSLDIRRKETIDKLIKIAGFNKFLEWDDGYQEKLRLRFFNFDFVKSREATNYR